MLMKRIVVLDRITKETIRRLEEETGWAVEERLGVAPEDLPGRVEDADVLIVRSGTKVTAEVIQAARRLKVIGRAGIGVDNIDMDAASERDIRVVNTPDATTVSVAELTLGAVLDLARNIHAADALVRSGEWDRKRFEGMEVKGKLIGVIGFGRIGREVARMAQAFGMRAVAYDPYLDESHVAGVHLHTLEDVLSRADFVSLHVPLEDETGSLMGREEMEAMKKGSFLLNFGRGGLVDEVALADLLESGHLAGCALDTYAVEPPGETLDRLKAHPRTLLLPHIGSMTREGQARVGMELVEGVGKAVRKIMSAKATALADRRQAAAEAAELAAAEEAAAAANGPVPPGLPGPT
ncbi:MAG: phosphoglycerate dehydrogenase, partial [Gemmatimonadetes bacterium]|nr:phosphoglycerate dehydrogenase [Gemmatimonadota bacterium]